MVMSGHMAPCAPRDGIVDRRWRNPVVRGDFLRSAPIPSYRTDVAICEPGMRVSLSSIVCPVEALLNEVVSTAQPMEMVRVDAPPVPTFVSRVHSQVRRFTVDRETNLSVNGWLAIAKLAIAAARKAPYPLKTRNRIVMSDSRIEERLESSARSHADNLAYSRLAV